MNEPFGRLEAAVADLVEQLKAAEYPFLAARRYFEILKSDPNWNPCEVSELRLEVIRELLAVQREYDGLSPEPSMNRAVNRA